MAITINGSGSIGGLSVGGLTDGCVDTDVITANAVTEAKLAANAVTEAKLDADVASGLCKAWVNFNGTGTVSIRSSYNVSSITDNNTGDYQVNFTTAMSDTNYCVNLSYSEEVNVAHGVGFIVDTTTTDVRVKHYNSANSTHVVDKSKVLVAVFR